MVPERQRNRVGLRSDRPLCSVRNEEFLSTASKKNRFSDEERKMSLHLYSENIFIAMFQWHIDYCLKKMASTRLKLSQKIFIFMLIEPSFFS